MFHLHMTGCDNHVLHHYFCIRTCHSSSAQTLLQTLDYGTRGDIIQCHVTKSCDSHDEIPLCIVNIVVVLIDVYGERSLTWLLGVCNDDLPSSLLAFVEQSIFQVWQMYHERFVSYKWFLECQLNSLIANTCTCMQQFK